MRKKGTSANTKAKTGKQFERHFKGVANHWRVDILELIAKRDGITVEEIAETLGGNFKTISAHTQRLVQSGLVNKRYRDKYVMHTLSPYGKRFHDFIKSF